MVAAPALDSFTRDALYQDLGKFPTPWLNFLDNYGLKVVALADGQTLADSPALQKFAATDLPSWRDKVQHTLGAALQQISPTANHETLLDNVHQWLTQQKAPFRLASHAQPLDLDALATQRSVPADEQKQWKADLLALNSPWSRLEESKLVSTHGLVLLPPIKGVPDDVFQNAVTTTSEFVRESLGLNRGADQLVLLHERYLPSRAPEIGEYRVAIHEVGHALDYALEGLPDETGFGTQHHDRIQNWFARDKQRGTFTSDRADDSPREYFAEAVEAYLTAPGQVDFRPDNHRQRLHELNPELENYLRTIFESQPASDWVSQPPAAQGMPPGFPDPDHDPIRALR